LSDEFDKLANHTKDQEV